jgi:uroporphyrinogen decarboxylase
MNDLLIRALRREPLARTPVWFMRQAGRSLPRYRELKGGRDLLETTRDPELAARITALPLEYFPTDAAVLFADISTIFLGAGIDVRIDRGVGPVLPHAYDSAARIRSLRPFEPRERLDFVLQTIRVLRERLEVPVIGFVGAPFTLMTYMVESPRSKDREGTKAFMWREPSLWEELMTYWADHLLAFALAQAEAGASAIQLFDSWAGALSPDDYTSCVLPHSRRILQGLKEAGVPSIHFATGNPSLLPLLARAGGDAIGLDWRVDIAAARTLLGPERAVQGNLDPARLLAGSRVAVSEAERILRKVKGGAGHIFNVGHGILPSTDPDVIKAVVDYVHSVDLEALRSAAALDPDQKEAPR